MIETKTLVVEKIREDEEIHNRNNNNGIQSEVDVETDDEKDREEEFKAWEARNIARMKRHREEREATLKDNEESGKAKEDDRGGEERVGEITKKQDLNLNLVLQLHNLERDGRSCRDLILPQRCFLPVRCR